MIYRTLSQNNPHVRYEHSTDSTNWCDRCRQYRALFVPMGKKQQKTERRVTK